MKQAKSKKPELFTKSFVKELEKLFRNCDEKVVGLAVEKLVKNQPLSDTIN